MPLDKIKYKFEIDAKGRLLFKEEVWVNEVKEILGDKFNRWYFEKGIVVIELKQ